jgi:hypothetical protein
MNPQESSSHHHGLKTALVASGLLALSMIGGNVAKAQQTPQERLAAAKAKMAQSASDQTKIVEVGDVQYKVSPEGPEMWRVDDIQGHMIGMGKRDSVAYPQTEPGFTIVKEAIHAYLTAGNTAAPAATATVATAAPAAAVAPAPGGQRTVEFNAAGEAIVTRPDGRTKVTISNEVMKGSVTAGLVFKVVTDPGGGYPVSTQTWSYKGGLQPASGGENAAHGFKGSMEAMANSANTRANAGVDVCSNRDNCFGIDAKSGGSETKNEIGGMGLGGHVGATGHDPKEQLEKKEANALRLDLDAVLRAINAANGNSLARLDIDSERSKREQAALRNITKDFTP